MRCHLGPGHQEHARGKTTFWVLVGAVVPFGGYVVDWWLLRDERRRAA